MTSLDGHLARGSEYIQQISIDCVIFGYEDGQLKVLAPKMIFKGDFWALPGGFIFQGESIDHAARRILKERTGLSDIFLQQFWVFGDAKRSNRKVFDKMLRMNDELVTNKHQYQKDMEWITRRFISIGYYALVDINKFKPRKSDIDESIAWYPANKLPKMMMDHNHIVEKALETLRENLDQRLIAFNLLPEKFTMKEVQLLYEAVLDRPLARNNFQKKMLDLGVLERLEKKFTGAANKAPYLYRFRR